MLIDIPIDRVWPTPRLIRAARGLLGIDQAKLAERAGVSRKVIVYIENDESDTMDYRRVAVVEKIAAALERDVEFTRSSPTRGEGVRLRK
jgi:transcriptional regulator with XRE-family HTH domain